MKQNNWLTKNELRKELQIIDKRFEEIDNRFETIDKRFEDADEKAKKYRDDILTKLDEVMGELQAMREDSVIGTHQISELREQVDNHEKRLVKLELTQQAE